MAVCWQHLMNPGQTFPIPLKSLPSNALAASRYVRAIRVRGISWGGLDLVSVLMPRHADAGVRDVSLRYAEWDREALSADPGGVTVRK